MEAKCNQQWRSYIAITCIQNNCSIYFMALCIPEGPFVLVGEELWHNVGWPTRAIKKEREVIFKTEMNTRAT